MMIEKIAVIGAGTMGAGIAQVGVEAGFTVTLVDTEQAFVDRGVSNIQRFVSKKVEKGKEMAVVESVKAASEVYAPASGEVISTGSRVSKRRFGSTISAESRTFGE